MIAHPTDRLLDSLFDRHDVRHEDHKVVAGEGWLDGRAVAVVGTADRAYIGVETALALAGHVLDVLRDHPGRPILLVVDNSGQRLSRWDELMGNNGVIAHLTTCLDFARRSGHRVVGVVHGLAVSGGFMATGMATAACHALPGAELRVMVPDAMARITRIPLDRLLTLFDADSILTDNIWGYLWGKLAYGAMLFGTALTNTIGGADVDDKRPEVIAALTAAELVRSLLRKPEASRGAGAEERAGHDATA